MGSRQASIIRRTVGGAAWTILTSIGARAMGAIGTIVLTYFIAPEIAGELEAAYVLVFSAHVFSNFGITIYITAKPKADTAMVWHATVMHLAIGVVPILATIPVAYVLGPIINAPSMALYAPGFAIAVLFERLHLLPERVLMRDIRFRPVSLARGLGEFAYTVLSVLLAMFWTKLGGKPETVGLAVVYGNIAQYGIMFSIVAFVANRKTWLTPAKLQWAKAREILRFGLPISVAGLSNFASRRFDNMVMLAMFGPGVAGAYTRAYNLADIPAVQIGEQIGDVLLPSFAQMETNDRRDALVRSTGLLSLIVFPLAVGLGSVSESLVAAILPKDWWQVGPMLAILSGLAVVRPVGWTIMSYLQACDRPRTVMFIGIAKVFILIGSVALFGHLGGPYWACIGASAGFLFHAVAGMVAVHRVDNVSMLSFVGKTVPPLLACIPMVGAVLGTRWLWAKYGVDIRGVTVVLEIAAGGIAYVLAALLVARSLSKDLIELVRTQMRKRRGGGDDDRPSDVPAERDSDA
jgi:lipopolysaccharide exporter